MVLGAASHYIVVIAVLQFTRAVEGWPAPWRDRPNPPVGKLACLRDCRCPCRAWFQGIPRIEAPLWKVRLRVLFVADAFQRRPSRLRVTAARPAQAGFCPTCVLTDKNDCSQWRQKPCPSDRTRRSGAARRPQKLVVLEL